jgi:hypothetical protein
LEDLGMLLLSELSNLRVCASVNQLLLRIFNLGTTQTLDVCSTGLVFDNKIEISEQYWRGDGESALSRFCLKTCFVKPKKC